MDLSGILNDKNTIKKLSFVLGMAKDSYKKQRLNPNNNSNIENTLKYYQELNIDEVEEIIEIIKQYQKEQDELFRDTKKR